MSLTFNYRHLYYFWVVAKEGGITPRRCSGWAWLFKR